MGMPFEYERVSIGFFHFDFLQGDRRWTGSICFILSAWQRNWANKEEGSDYGCVPREWLSHFLLREKQKKAERQDALRHSAAKQELPPNHDCSSEFPTSRGDACVLCAISVTLFALDGRTFTEQLDRQDSLL